MEKGEGREANLSSANLDTSWYLMCFTEKGQRDDLSTAPEPAVGCDPQISRMISTPRGRVCPAWRATDQMVEVSSTSSPKVRPISAVAQPPRPKIRGETMEVKPSGGSVNSRA
ncbi:hypothetical protein RRG08_033452 [Elysia crispata]|uniref:Uncharacterized protein n=1 Tax=Elysia crispata TaxID=231223 RepID=A0AAE1E537_9GAST|nr:hypothetical protein RRG08_033452 [Elysia crispata]